MTSGVPRWVHAVGFSITCHCNGEEQSSLLSACGMLQSPNMGGMSKRVSKRGAILTPAEMGTESH